MSEQFETPQSMLAGALAGFGMAEELYRRGDFLSQINAARIAYGAADLFELGAGTLIAGSMRIGELAIEDEQVFSMRHEDFLRAAPEAVLAVNGLADTLGPFSRSMLEYTRAETMRRFGKPTAD